jgi:hypothetical protein
MNRDESHAALLAAARALQRDGVSGPGLAQLYAALDALDAGGDVDRIVPDSDRCADRDCWCWTVAAPVGPHGHQAGRTAPTCVLTLPECRTPGCWYAADLPGGTCHRCSDAGKAPLPFERAQRRDPVFGGHDGD